MSCRCGLPCSLRLLAVVLFALAGSARGAETTSTNGEAKQKEPTWSFEWSDVGIDDGELNGVPPGQQFYRVNASSPPQAPPAIAAPLPPALIPGLIGLAGVYAYKRRHRLR